MKNYFLIIGFVLFIAGCATPQINEFRTWVAQTKPIAKSGQMLWSDYYTQFYDKVNALPSGVQGKGFYLQAAAIAIDASKSYESGKISEDEFQSFQRQLIAQEAEYTEKQQRMNSQAVAQAYSQYLQNQAAIASSWNSRQPTYQPPMQTRCISRNVGNTVQTSCH